MASTEPCGAGCVPLACTCCVRTVSQAKAPATAQAQRPSTMKGVRQLLSWASRAPTAGLEIMPRVSPDCTQAMRFMASAGAPSAAMAKAMGSMPALASPVITRVASPTSKLATRPVATEAAPNSREAGSITRSRPRRSDRSPSRGAMRASATL